MSSVTWTLEPDAEREYLLPWLLSEPDPVVRERVLRFLADMLRDPDRPSLMSESGVYSTAAVPSTDVGITWVLDAVSRQLVLAHVG